MNTRQVAAVLLFSIALSSAAVRADQVSPFKGTWEGKTIAADFSQFPPFVAVIASGTGEATHLGHFTMVSPHLNNVFTQEVEGEQNFTAANGDTLTAHFTGVLTGDPFVSLEGTLPCTITGGTGRFAGATGQYDFHIVATPLADGSGYASVATFDGVIVTVEGS
jgi:hypothetical protein